MKNNMLKFTSFFLTVFLILTGCKKEETFKRAYYKTVYDVYNTHVNLSSFNQKDLDNLFPGFSALAVSLHKDFDRDAKYLNEDYNFFNNLKVVNDAYGTGQTIKVSDNLFYVLKLSMKMFELTEGYFNPALGSLIDIWNPKFEYTSFDSEEMFMNNDPNALMINKALNCVPTYNELKTILILNEERKEITFNSLNRCDGRVILSLGAIGKGYAMDKLKEYYLSNTSTSGSIDGGSSSLLTIGNNPNKREGKDGAYDNYWNIEIKAPYPNQHERLFIYQNKGDLAVSTSGNSVKYFYLVDDSGNKLCQGTSGFRICDEYEVPIRRTHILNPFTGYPENYYDNITIISKQASAGVLDALTTAIYNVGDFETVKRIIKNVETYFNVEIDYYFGKMVEVEYLTEYDSIGKKLKVSMIVNDSMNEKIDDLNENLIKEKNVINLD